MINKPLKLIIAACMLVSINANAADDVKSQDRKRIEPFGLLYGFGLGLNQELYKGYDRRVIPLPIIGYRGKDLQIFGPFASYDIIDNEHWALSGKLTPRFEGFDEDDSYIFAGMDKRKFSMDAGLGLQYKYNNWKVGATTMFDVLGRSKGFESGFDLSKVYRTGPVFFEPKITLAYLDDDMVNYYYGVRAHEATATRAQYTASAALNTTVGLSITTPIFFSGLTRLGLSHTWYDSSIADSPLTDTDSGFSFFLSYSRFFKM